MNRNIKKYLKKVRADIPCGFRKKKQLMHAFLTSLEQYLHDNPDATDQDIVDAFGPPKEMAEMLSEKISESEARQYRRRKKVVFTASILLICLLLAWIIFLLYDLSVPVNIVQTTIIHD